MRPRGKAAHFRGAARNPLEKRAAAWYNADVNTRCLRHRPVFGMLVPGPKIKEADPNAE